MTTDPVKLIFFEGRDVSEAILVVDNSEIARLEVIGPLRQAGYEVFEAEDGEQALQSISQRSFGLVITDVHMPVMNGIEFCEALNAADFAAKPLVLVVSTESNAELKGRAKKAGARGWIIKPVDTTALLQAVKLLLDRARRA